MLTTIDQEYSSGLSILHFEDQYMDMVPFIQDLYLILNTNVISKNRNAHITKKLIKKDEGCRVYEFEATDGVKLPKIRYILTSDEVMTDELNELQFEKRIFILDAWRNQDTGNALRSNIEETFTSINGYYSEISDVVIYTAYPGNRDRLKADSLPIELNKTSPEELQTYLTECILTFLDSK